MAVLFGLLVCPASWGEEESPPLEEQVPDYRTLMLRNMLLPGSAQLALGQRGEGIVYLASLPLQVVGTTMMVAQLVLTASDAHLGLGGEGSRTYLLEEDDPSRTPGEQWLFYAGTTISLYGGLLGAYSQYAAHRDYVDRYGERAGLQSLRTGRERLPELLAAPFRPRAVFSLDVLPVLALIFAGTLAVEDIGAVGAYFGRETVPFMGMLVSPWAGLGLRLATAMLLVTANATLEEVAYRGLSLEQVGVARSSLAFGLAHLSNALLPGVSVEDTLLQTLFALGYGFYAAHATVAAGYRLERMVALHYWNNILAFTLGYLVDPESQRELGIGIRLPL